MRIGDGMIFLKKWRQRCPAHSKGSHPQSLEALHEHRSIGTLIRTRTQTAWGLVCNTWSHLVQCSRGSIGGEERRNALSTCWPKLHITWLVAVLPTETFCGTTHRGDCGRDHFGLPGRPLVEEVVRRATVSMLRAVTLAHVFQRSGRAWLMLGMDLRSGIPGGVCHLD